MANWHYHYPETTSTNAIARDILLDQPVGTISLITADCQTFGRGRRGRSWYSPKGGNIYATWCWSESSIPKWLPSLPLVLALTTCEVLKSLNIPLKIKWPNDLLMEQKKIGGILAECWEHPKGQGIALGMGFNQCLETEISPPIDQPFTSLKSERKEVFDPFFLYEILDKGFIEALDQLKNKGFSPFHSAYLSYLNVQEGAILFLNEPQKKIEGIFKGIAPDGALLLESKNKISKFYSGDFDSSETSYNRPLSKLALAFEN